VCLYFSVFYPSERCRAFAARFRTVLRSAAALSQRVSALFFGALPRFRSAFPHCSSERCRAFALFFGALPRFRKALLFIL